MSAPTPQQTKQMKQESPAWQAKQTEDMYRQKWQGIFSNTQLCEKYAYGAIIGGDSSAIPVPEDPTERKVAQEVASSILARYKSMGHDNMSDVEMYCVPAAKKFIRACNTYTKKRDKEDIKNINKFQKENPGVGAYSQGQLIPMSNNTVDMFDAGTNAGKQAAQYYMTSDQTSQDNLAQQIKQYMQDKCYNTCFWYAFYSSIKPHDNTTLATQKQRLDYLKPIYNQYAAIAKPQTMSERQKSVTAKQAYTDMANQQGRR